MGVATNRRARALLVLLLVAVAAALFCLLLSRTVQRPLTHDEHQFIAPAALIARDGLVPYRDFAYFHAPYLAWLHAAVFAVTDHLLLGARLHSVACATLLLVAIAVAAFRSFAGGGLVRTLFAGAAVAILLFDPLFTLASGMAWNHDASALCAVLGFLALAAGLRSERWLPLALGGGALALATGIRLSAAPLVVAAGIGALLLARRRVRALAAVALGAFAGALPMLVLCAMEPRRFWFGNFVYPEYNERAYRESPFQQEAALTLAAKFGFVRDKLLSEPGTLALLLLFVLFAAIAFARRVHRGAAAARAPELPLAALFVPFALVGACAPTPSWPQYYFGVLPFLLLGAAYGASRAAASGPRSLACGALAAFVLAAAVSVASGARAFAGFRTLFEPREWEPVKVHALGREIGAATGGGLVFTQQVTGPLEGGCRIYPHFAVGPFGWRVAPMLPSRRDRLDLLVLGAEDMPGVLQAEPPDAVHGLSDGSLLGPLEEYVRRNRFRQTRLSNGDVLWLRPGL